MANLVIDIGSLSVKAALADGGQLGKIFRYQGYKVADFISRIVSGGKVETCAVSSSGPADPNLIKVLKENCREVILPGDFTRLPVDFGEASASLPPDRKASIVAASILFKGLCRRLVPDLTGSLCHGELIMSALEMIMGLRWCGFTGPEVEVQGHCKVFFRTAGTGYSRFFY